MKQRVYTDTSVFGGYFDEEFKDGSIQLFDEFKIGIKIMVISDITLRELQLAPENVRNLLGKIPDQFTEFIRFDDDAKFLSTKYVEDGAVSEKYLLDAQHIAIASLNHVDVLVSWNFKHIVNLRRIQLYNSINLKYGYPMIEIRIPKEIIDEEQGK
ncbi:MAG: PIN domain protein [Chitinispirillia bacterium]|jgi:hypothetical protein